MGSVDSASMIRPPVPPMPYPYGSRAGSHHHPSRPATALTRDAIPTDPFPTPSILGNPVTIVRNFASRHLTPEGWYNDKVMAAQRREAEMQRERMFIEAEDGGRVIQEGEVREVV